MRPKEIIKIWVDAFNRADVDTLISYYAENAINHQVAYEPIEGKESIRKMFVDEFARAEMICII